MLRLDPDVGLINSEGNSPKTSVRFERGSSCAAAARFGSVRLQWGFTG